jgi:hypothetical protein
MPLEKSSPISISNLSLSRLAMKFKTINGNCAVSSMVLLSGTSYQVSAIEGFELGNLTGKYVVLHFEEYTQTLPRRLIQTFWKIYQITNYEYIPGTYLTEFDIIYFTADMVLPDITDTNRWFMNIGILNSPSNFGPMSLGEFFRNGEYVPGGVPNTGMPYVFEDAPISFNNFSGSNSQYVEYRNMPSLPIFNDFNSKSDNVYFGGEIPRALGAWQFRRSEGYFLEFTLRSQWPVYQVRIDAFNVRLLVGYTFYDPGPFRSTRYYYDYILDPGISIVRVQDDAAVRFYRLSYTTPQFSDTTVTVPQTTLTIPADPGAPGTFRIYYTSFFQRNSDIAYGDFSFGWIVESGPLVTIFGTKQ